MAQDVVVANAVNLANGNLAVVGALAVLLFDWATTFDREIEAIWKPKWTLGTLLFFMNRTLPVLSSFLHLTTTVATFTPTVQLEVCRPLVQGIYTIASFHITIVQVILALRTYALYDCNRIVLGGLLFLAVGGLVNQNIPLYIHHMYAVPNYLPPPYTGCLLLGLPKWSWERYVPLLVFEMTAICLTLARFVRFHQTAGKEAGRSMVSKVLYRDGFAGFFAVCLGTALGLFIQIIRPQSLLTFSLVLTPVIPCLIASRLLLNIRDVMRLDPHQLTGTSTSSSLPSQRRSTMDKHSIRTSFTDTSGQATPMPAYIEMDPLSLHRSRSGGDIERGDEKWIDGNDGGSVLIIR